MRLKPYYTALKRYHRSKGHGIHSPFAFSFTVKVLHERCAYYAYDDIDRWRREAISLARGRSRHPRIISAKHARLLFRVACYFRPRTVMFVGNTYGVSALAVMRADSRSRIVIYPGAQHHDDIFQSLAEDCRNHIDVTPSLAAADGLYRNACGSCPPFIVVSHLDAADADEAAGVLLDALDREGVVIVRNITRSHVIARLWQQLNLSLDHGMTFSNERMGIIVGHRHLPRQSFSLWF